MTPLDLISGRKVGVIGMARSGIAAAFLVQNLGGQPFVSDSAAADKLSEPTRELRRAAIPFETDGHSEKLLSCDFLIVSPGVPLEIDILNQARAKGLPIFSEIEVASWVCKGGIIAVTGSNGKTTTTTLIGEILAAGGRDAFVCGNIGLPFSEVALGIPNEGLAVVEVSTFQLETVEQFHPEMALILNLSPDHLDRHGSFEAYKAMKYRVTENQLSIDYLVLNRDDETLMTDSIETQAKTLHFSTSVEVDAGAFVRDEILYGVFQGDPKEIMPVADIRIPGPHNLQNVAAAVCVAMRYNIPPDVVAEVLRTFGGVEHRLEQVGRVAGVYFVNDSKATNVDSVCYALRSIDTPIYLIAGGRDKGAPYTPIAEFGKDKIRGIVAIGEARDRIFNELGKTFPTQFADTLEQAVKTAFDLAHPGETVLLSPACASFDMFSNFEERGRAFKAAVDGLRNGKKNNSAITQ